MNTGPIKTISDRKIRNAFTRWLDAASEDQYRQGIRWYSAMRTEAARRANALGATTLEGYLRVVAILSPRLPWDKNLEYADAVVSGWQAGLDWAQIRTGAFNRNQKRAYESLADPEFKFPATAPKISNFYLNLLHGGGDNVTIDTWMVRAIYAHPNIPALPMTATEEVPSLTKAQYARVAICLAEVADRHGVQSAQAQAVIWETIRDYYRGG